MKKLMASLFFLALITGLCYVMWLVPDLGKAFMIVVGIYCFVMALAWSIEQLFPPKPHGPRKRVSK